MQTPSHDLLPHDGGLLHHQLRVGDLQDPARADVGDALGVSVADLERRAVRVGTACADAADAHQRLVQDVSVAGVDGAGGLAVEEVPVQALRVVIVALDLDVLVWGENVCDL